MMPLDLRYFRATPHDDEGGGCVVWLAIILSMVVGILIGAM